MRYLLLMLLSLVCVSVPARADTILVFGQSGGDNLFTADETAGTTVLNATNVPTVITTLNEMAVTLPAQFTLTASSIAPAVPSVTVPGAWTQLYSGAFQMTQGGSTALSGTFTGLSLGVVNGNQLIFGAGSTPPLALSFASDLALPLDPPRAMALSLTNLTPAFSISNGSFGDFSANVAGTFSAVPEPGTLVLVGLGLVGLAARLRRRA
jgi:PEP-CTERM motif